MVCCILMTINMDCSLTSEIEMCLSIGDALKKLAAGERCSRYLPEIDWNAAERGLGLPSSCVHLITHGQTTGPSDDQHNKRNTKIGENDEILQRILECLDIATTDFSPELPLTSFGLDSLSATKVSQLLRPYVSISQMQLLGGITWPQILDRMDDLRKLQARPEPENLSIVDMLDMVTKYSQNFKAHQGSIPISTKDVVVITGSTGSIGAYVLAELIASPKVARVYALNRRSYSSNLFHRQKEALLLRGLDPVLAESPKLVLLEADLARPSFGLVDSKFHEEVSLTRPAKRYDAKVIFRFDVR